MAEAATGLAMTGCVERSPLADVRSSPAADESGTPAAGGDTDDTGGYPALRSACRCCTRRTASR